MVDDKNTPQRRHDIIASIMDVNEIGVRNALAEDPNCVNAVHEASGMSASMLCVYGRLSAFFDILVDSAGRLIDFSHTDLDGDDLMSISIGTLDSSLMNKVQSAYERFSPQDINNWPEP